MSTTDAIAIEHVVVSETRSGLNVIDDVSLEVRRGELLAIVGESGAGKTTTGLALLGHARPGLEISHGHVHVGAVDILALDERGLAGARGRVVSFVPQNPAAALNPSQRVVDQVRDALDVHGFKSGQAAIASLFERVALPTTPAFLRRYPHQLSGGQKQRVSIAIALACRPDLIVLDEPTTALDVITQARILQLIADLRAEGSSAFVYVTHDIAAVAAVASHVAIMYAGRVVERGPLEAILAAPKHPYTRGLIAAVPSVGARGALRGITGVAPSLGSRPLGCAFEPRCSLAVERCREQVPELESVEPEWSVRCIRWRDGWARSTATRAVAASKRRHDELLRVEGVSAAYHGSAAVLEEVSFAIRRGECVAIVGESGSGKTTLARCVVGLHSPAEGSITLENTPLAPSARRRSREERRRIQIIFQNPDESLNPRIRIGTTVGRPAQQLCGLDRQQANERTANLLARVRLAPDHLTRYPAQLSGGERQRVSIARALAAGPDLLVCDEVTSALDVSVQASVVELLGELRESGLAILFVSHDLAVVTNIADRILVLERGRVCDEGSTSEILGSPRSEYTRQLIAAAPTMPALAE